MGISIRTGRLILDDLNRHDLLNIMRLVEDPAVMRYVLMELRNDEEVIRFFRRGIEESEKKDRMSFIFAIRTPGTGAFAGLAFLEIDPVSKSTAEVGCVLHQDYWGKGYASEILNTLLAFGFEDLSLHRIFGKCDELNLPSAWVMEKCGLKYEGTLREHVWLRDHWRSSRYFGILSREYRSSHPSPLQG